MQRTEKRITRLDVQENPLQGNVDTKEHTRSMIFVFRFRFQFLEACDCRDFHFRAEKVEKTEKCWCPKFVVEERPSIQTNCNLLACRCLLLYLDVTSIAGNHTIVVWFTIQSKVPSIENHQVGCPRESWIRIHYN